MAAGRVILASDDAPVREVIRPGVDGLLASPGDLDAWVRLAKQVLANPADRAPLGLSASDIVRERYDRDATLPRLAERLNQRAGLGG
jgi:glycosyltransferase involved in cell wall biosynthesis